MFLGQINNQITNSIMQRQLARSASGGVAVNGNGFSIDSRGLAGGDPLGKGKSSPYGAWYNFAHSDNGNQGVLTAYNGTMEAHIFGVDYAPTESTLIGLAGTLNEANSVVTANIGGVKTSGFAVTPYAAWMINDIYSVDVTGGYGNGDTTQFRNPFGTLLNSKFGVDRWFTAGNVNALYTVNQWVFQARTGILYANEDQDRYVETNNGATVNTIGAHSYYLTQWQTGGTIGYLFNKGSLNNFEPYAGAVYRLDVAKSSMPVPTGYDDVQFQTGVRWFARKDVSAEFRWTSDLARTNFSNDTFMFNARATF
jgi:hypothetical protein